MDEIRLIDANALRKAVDAMCIKGKCTGYSYEDDSFCVRCSVQYIKNLIDNAQTVEQPQGEWIGNYDNLSQSFYWSCNKCNYKQSWGRFNHCPNCGAKMYDRTRVKEQKNES